MTDWPSSTCCISWTPMHNLERDITLSSRLTCSSMSAISFRSRLLPARVLAPDGLFAFTVETHASDGVVLQQTLRYAHGAAHVRTAIADAGLNLAGAEPCRHAQGKGAPVPSLVVVATGSRP